MKRLPLVFTICVLSLFCFESGLLLYQAPKSPDIYQGWGMPAGAFLLFLSYFFSQLCWGDLLSRLGTRACTLWEKFFFGSAFFALLPAMLGFLPLLGANAAVAWKALLLAGPFLLLLQQSLRPRAGVAMPPFSRLDIPAYAAIALAFIGAFTPHAFWDSLWYHLTASRLWFAEGHLYLPASFPIALKTGLWDYHFLWGQWLLGGPGDTGLIAAQLFGQWAQLACVLFSFLALRSCSGALGLSFFSLLAALAGTELFAVAEFAKNDWAAVFWGLSALCFWAEERSVFLVALAAGLCFAAKFSAAFGLLPFLLWQAWLLRGQWRRLSIAIAIFAAAALPLLVRNAYFTGNPFFPALQIWFPEFLGPSWKNIAIYEGHGFSPAAWREKLFYLVRDSGVILVLAFFPFVRRHFAPRIRRLLACSVLSALLFFFFTGDKAEWRLLGAGLVLLAAYGARTLELSLERLAPVLTAALPRVLLLAALFVLPLDWQAPLRLWKADDASLQVRSWPSGAAMAWVRQNVVASDSVATLNEQRIYYLFPHAPLRVFDDPALDRLLAAAQNEKDVVMVLRQAGIRYLVLSAEFLDLYYDRKICDWMYLLSEREPAAVVFRAELSRVLDLSRLRTP